MTRAASPEDCWCREEVIAEDRGPSGDIRSSRLA